MFLNPYQSSIILYISLKLSYSFITPYKYNLRIPRDHSVEIIPLLPHTKTYLHGSHLTNDLLIAYYLLFIPQYTLQIAPHIFL